MIGKMLTLKGKSRKGKNKVYEWGSRWIVMRTENSGHNLLIRSLSDTMKAIVPPSSRWINKIDVDFEIKWDRQNDIRTR